MTTEKRLMAEQEENNCKRIRLYLPLLEQSLMPSFIVHDLNHILGKDGVQTIQKAEEESAELGAVRLLEVLMRSRKPGWFQAFISALKENGFDMFANLLLDEREVIDEELYAEFLSKSCKRLINEVNALDLLPTLLENRTITEKDVADITTADNDNGSKSAIFLLLFLLPCQNNSWFYEFISALKQNQTKSYQTLAGDIEAAMSEEGELVSLVENDLVRNDFISPSESSQETTSEKKILNTTTDLHNSCESQSDTDAEISQIRNAGNERGAGDGKEQEIQAQPLVLYSYQKELAEPALNGKNVIIVAPTGSGKTHVALYITQNHFKESGRKRVVFFVPTTELVSQQERMYLTYLNSYKVYGLSGEVQASQKVPISSLVDKYDILVMTPQVLLNALEKKDVVSLRVFTLMIFDECHHTTKEHPYNNIMAAYLNEKYREDRDYYLPQIVGLTASVGVGKAHTLDKAIRHILLLCANLNALDGISIVENNKEELNKHVNMPKEGTIEKHGRKEDPFRKIVSKMMETIEECMRKLLASQGSTLAPLSEMPPHRGCDQYTQWISRINKAVVKLDLDIRRSLYACQLYLKHYNIALMIHDDCRTTDALRFLNKQIHNIDSSHKDETDTWLEKLFNEKREELETISQDPRFDNPKLNELARVLLDKYNKNPEMRAIVFCRTREMTLALQDWIKETPELKMLKPNRLVGSNAPEEKGGMTQHKQEDVLTYFKDGKHNVIIATSVAEEGIDVSKCNLVVIYEYPTNETARIQTRGRGRAEDSDYIVLGDHSRGATQKEEMNKIREKMMNRAIKEVNRISDREREREILKLQREAIEERKMAEAGRKKVAASSQPASDHNWELRCVKCNQLGCLVTDLRVVERSHHVVLDESFGDRRILERHPNEKKIDDVILTDKIFCGKCHHDWGTCCIYKNVKLPVIKIASFVAIDVRTQSRNTYRKWKQVPFSISILSSDELSEYSKNQMDSEF